METIMKIPFLLAIFAAIVTGLFSIAGNKDLNQTCIRMIIAMIGFYIVGLFVSSTLTNIIDEQNESKLEAEKSEQELEKERLEEEGTEQIDENGHLGNNIDFVTDNKLDDGFTPIDLSQAVKAKLKE